MTYEKAKAEVVVFDHREFMVSSGTWTDAYGNRYVCGGVTKGSGDWYKCERFAKYNREGQQMSESSLGFSCSSYVLP